MVIDVRFVDQHALGEASASTEQIALQTTFATIAAEVVFTLKAPSGDRVTLLAVSVTIASNARMVVGARLPEVTRCTLVARATAQVAGRTATGLHLIGTHQFDLLDAGEHDVLGVGGLDENATEVEENVHQLVFADRLALGVGEAVFDQVDGQLGQRLAFQRLRMRVVHLLLIAAHQHQIRTVAHLLVRLDVLEDNLVVQLAAVGVQPVSKEFLGQLPVENAGRFLFDWILRVKQERDRVLGV